MTLIELLVCFGITFGIMNKNPLHDKLGSFMNNMFMCAYCTGFHVGWALYLTKYLDNFNLLHAASYAFASSAFCYCLDAITAYLESKSED